jgi:hypothetical protein
VEDPYGLYFSLFSPSENGHNTLGRIGRRRAEAPTHYS